MMPQTRTCSLRHPSFAFCSRTSIGCRAYLSRAVSSRASRYRSLQRLAVLRREVILASLTPREALCNTEAEATR